ncbi:phosphate ABC transporter permease [Bifidobacterium italicum]|uniref:Phosphate transport system permease protein n=1 Tax=Bifidobacterium italicum TaxID=1960968 RepID=A0A2A2ELY5_9BIFI|nr:phosphate ABC transporter permease [Bifidobacterium italicum]
MPGNDLQRAAVDEVAVAPIPKGTDPGEARRGRAADRIFAGLAYGSGLLILAVLAAVAVFLLLRAWPAVGGPPDAVDAVVSSFTGGRFASLWGYVPPLLFGSVLVAALALALAFFVSLGIAVFISQYAPRRLVGALNTIIDLLAAIPSVVYGLWGGLVLVPAIYPFWNWIAGHFGWIPLFAGPAANPSRTVATVALVLAVMILPIITSMTRDIFLQTPKLLEEAALGLGATQWETIRLAVLPFGRSGIVSASMLGLGRALGETMAVLMILSPGLKYSFHLLQASQSQTIAANIAAQYPEANGLGVSVLIATGLVLFAITFAVNYAARRLTGKAAS